MTSVTRDRRRRVALVVVVTILVAATACWAALTIARSAAGSAERTETVRLLAQAKLIRGSIEPIARDYTSRADSSTIDVTAFAKRLSDARRIVDAVNEIEIVTDEGLVARDLLLGGGESVIAGLESALDALVRDDAAAASEAGMQVDEGVGMLDEAQNALETRMQEHGWTE